MSLASWSVMLDIMLCRFLPEQFDTIPQKWMLDAMFVVLIRNVHHSMPWDLRTSWQILGSVATKKSKVFK
jgi:hypothetical protein